MKFLALIAVSILAVSVCAKKVEGPTIRFDVPVGVDVKEYVLPEANIETFILTWDDSGTIRNMTLSVPDLSRWKDASFEKWYVFAARSQIKNASRKGDENQIAEEVIYGDFRGFQFRVIEKGNNGEEIVDVNAYLTAGNTKNIEIFFDASKNI